MKRILVLLAVLTMFAAACGSGDETTASGDDGATSEDGQPEGTEESEEAGESEKAGESEGTGGDDAGGEDVIVFVWSETGGCAQAGPNCARYEVTSTGNVSTYREGEQVAEVTGTIDAARVEQWMAIVAETDVDELVARLGPGELTAAFDGVDYVLEAPGADLRLSSVDVAFDRSEALFQDAEALAGLAAKAAPLEIKMR